MRVFLYILSIIYSIAIRLRAVSYRLGLFHSVRLNCKIISIGNITVGGTGKTTLTEFLAGVFIKKGVKVAILSRGSASYVVYDKPCMDEPSMLKENLPSACVLVGKDRVKNARLACKDYNADVLILDDGFQNLRIYRELDIVAIDSTNPFGQGMLLPYGILREPVSSLKRAQIFCLTKVDLADKVDELKLRLLKINPDALIVESIHKVKGLYEPLNKENLDVGILKNKRVLLVSSIGDPVSFEKMMRRTGALVGHSIVFSDHHQYRLKDLNHIYSLYNKTNAEAIVTTQKDWVKLSGKCKVESIKWENIKILILKIELEIVKNGEEFFRRLNRVFLS